MKEIDVTIFSTPSLATFTCPYCGEGNDIEYSDWEDEVGNDFNEWRGSIVSCPHCDKDFVVESFDFYE